MNPLLDSEFLVKLNSDKNRTIYAHVISLNQYEHPIEQIEGVVTTGSLTIDGQSAVRRVCSLTLSAKNLNINDVYWGISTKVKIEIGLQNNIDPRYDDIIWFPQGLFILTNFKTTQMINNYTINLSGKDKMCLLNGDVSGNLPAPIRFDSYTDNTKQSYTIDNTGFYNNFIDNDALQALISGFKDRYGSDYQFIQGAKKIITLQYIPIGNNINDFSLIKFSQDEDYQNIYKIATKSEITIDGKVVYDISIADKGVFGFIVDKCIEGDQFIWTIEQKIPLAIIIQELLHQFGQEKYSNIIIKDIEPYALEMLDSVYNENYYLLHDGTSYSNFIPQDKLITDYILEKDEQPIAIDLKTNKISNIVFKTYIDEDDDSLVKILNKSTLQQEKISTTYIINKKDKTKHYTVLPIYPNEAAGYGMTLLVYPDELIGQPGDSITSILDKIVNMLGEYEYFYSLDGQFIFQGKPAYIKTPWNGTIYLDNENYVEPSELVDKVAYTFDDAILTTQYQNTPNMNNIKNDYIIWGERKNLNGNTIKFHGRYAIENIPLEYTDFNGYTWTSSKKESIIKSVVKSREEAISNYKHIFDYPKDAFPETTGWWEINDWAYFYQSIFNINLATTPIMMMNFHPHYSELEKAEGKDIFNELLLPKLPGYLNQQLKSVTDVVTLGYSKNGMINEIYSHGNCSHYYCDFMNLQILDEGWTYKPISNLRSQIINVLDATKKFTLNNGVIRTSGYTPFGITTEENSQYNGTISFIYKPTLPQEILNNSTDITVEESINTIYSNAQNENGQMRQYALDEDVDWRHLIHIMADDWYAHHTEDDYEINLRKNNSWPELNIDLYPYGRTGYEQYYLDFTSSGGFWSDVYNTNYLKYKYYKMHPSLALNNLFTWQQLQKKYEEKACELDKYGSLENIKQINFNNGTFQDNNTSYNIKLTISDNESINNFNEELELLKDYLISSEWDNSTIELQVNNAIILEQIIKPEISFIYDFITKKGNLTSPYNINIGQLYSILEVNNNLKNYFSTGQYKYWIQDIINQPENLTFWFDFFQADEMGIGKFAVSVIGDRPKTINDSAIKTIIYKDTPDVIYCSLNEYLYYSDLMLIKTGYQYIILNDKGVGYSAEEIIKNYKLLRKYNENSKEYSEIKQIWDSYGTFASDIKYNNFIRSIRHKTVHEQAEFMLYQYSYYNDTVNINHVPIYYLVPNTIISIKDELSKIIGYYVINKINISLSYNGMMQISAIKSPTHIY